MTPLATRTRHNVDGYSSNGLLGFFRLARTQHRRLATTKKKQSSFLDSTTPCNLDFRSGRTTLSAQGLNLLNELKAFNNFAENDVLAIEPGSRYGGDKELGSVRIRASVGHGQKARFIVPQGKVLVRESLAVDGLATRAVVPGEITALKHELRNHTVETGTRIAEVVLASSEFTEVSRGFGYYFVIQPENDTTSMGTADGDVEVDVGHGYLSR